MNPGALYNMRIFTLLRPAFAGCALSLVMACGPGEPEGPEGTPLVKVNDSIVTVENFEEELRALEPRQRALYNNPQGRRQFMQTIISMELLHQEGLRQGLDKNEDIEEKLRQHRRKLIIDHILHSNIGMPEILRYFQDNFARARHIVLTFDPQMDETAKDKQKLVMEGIREKAVAGVG